MGAEGQGRRCRCGTRLARDNRSSLCNACTKATRNHRLQPPVVPPEFWRTAEMRAALAAHDMGAVMRAFRMHPFHGRAISQEVAAGWVGLTQTRLSRIEGGCQLTDLTKLMHWARVLQVPTDLLWFRMPSALMQRQAEHSSGAASTWDDGQGATWRAQVPPSSVEPEAEAGGRLDDMNRRELLRLLSMAGTVVTLPAALNGLDWDRLDFARARPAGIDGATLDEYAALNAHLWQVFSLSQTKATTFPVVRSHLETLTTALHQSQRSAVYERLCAMAGDLFQLAGEICFDDNRYTDAAYCYSLAATASREASAFDLWACAMARHAFIGVYEGQFDKSAPMLELAAGLARLGDPSLSTRHWIAVVQAETFAGLGELDACERALSVAERVHELDGPVHNGGWLRFDGSRLLEERGTCYAQLGRPDLAEAVLVTTLEQTLSVRRRGAVLVDLATVGAQRCDVDQLVVHADAALDMQQQTGSGYLSRKVQALRSRLEPLLTDKRVRHLDDRITSLTDTSAAY